MFKIKKLIFDADDTLWENNKFFLDTSDSFFDLCVDAGYERNLVVKAFNDFELKVVNERGYGSANFIYILDHLFSHFNKSKKLNSSKYNKLLNKFKSHTINDPPVFSNVPEVLNQLKKNYDLYVLTKGNIKEQKQKIERSGLKHFFNKEFVVPEKNDNTYLTILNEYNWRASECCMIGNSPKSDINPALRCGMYTIFIPYPYTWILDNEDLIENHSKFYEAKDFSEIPYIIKKLSKS
jgi:putative hydrolase of the HAD superfamily